MRKISIWLTTIGLLVLCVKNLSAAPVDSTRVKQMALTLESFYWMTFSYNFPIKGIVEQISDEGLHYDVYRQSSLIGSTTNTHFTDTIPLPYSCEYAVSAMWNGGCTQSVSMMVEAPEVPMISYGDTTATVCDSFNWYEYTGITVSGEYTHTFVGESASGGDSVVTLHLTVTDGALCAPQISFTSNSQNNSPFHFCRYAANAWICAFAESNGECADTEYDYKWQADCYDTTYFGACIEIPTQEVHCCTYTVTVTSLATGCETVTPIEVCVDHLNSIEFIVNDEPFTSVPRIVYFCVDQSLKIGVNPDCWEHAVWTNGYHSVSDPTYDFIVEPYTTTPGIMKSFCIDVIDTNGCPNQGVISVVSYSPYLMAIHKTVCQEQLPLEWNGVIFTEAGSYYDTLATVNGCDSVVVMMLHVGPVIDEKSCPGTPTVTDHEGNIYATVQIGEQCWMRENLRTTTSPSTGTYLIPSASKNYTFTGKQARWYNNDSATYSQMNYGLLYNWNAAVDTFNTAYGETNVNTNSSNAVSVSFTRHRRGICPAGWHLPSDAEWTTMTDYVSSHSEYVCDGNSSYIAKALADSVGWCSSGRACCVGNHPNNAIGFDALPAGNFTYYTYNNSNFGAYFWSATESSGSYAWNRYLYYYYAYVNRYGNYKSNGYSVRCLRDSVPCVDFVPPVFHGMLPDGHVCPENGSYFVPDFTTYFSNTTVSDNSYPFSSLTINQNPAAGTEIDTDTDTEVTITLADPCGNVSSYSVEVMLNYAFDTAIFVSVCESELPVTLSNGFVVDFSCVFYDTMINSNGCDSVIITYFMVQPTTYSTPDSVVCSNDLPLTWNGSTFTEAGTQTVTLTSATGCDSVVVMTLHVSDCGPVEYGLHFPYNLSVETIAGHCNEDGHLIFILLDNNGNEIQIDPQTHNAANTLQYPLYNVQYHYQNVSDGLGMQYDYDPDILLMAGSYCVGISAKIPSPNGGYMLVDTTFCNVQVTTSHQHLEASVLFNISNGDWNNMERSGWRPSFMCADMGRIQLQITQGSFPYEVTILDDQLDTIRHSFFHHRVNSGNNTIYANYRDYYTFDSLAVGTYSIIVSDSCGYVIPLSFTVPDAEPIRYFALAPTSISECPNGTVIPFELERRYDLGANEMWKNYNFPYLDSILLYRFVNPENDTTEWRHVISTYSSSWVTLYDTIPTYCEIFQDTIKVQLYDLCHDTLMTYQFRFLPLFSLIDSTVTVHIYDSTIYDICATHLQDGISTQSYWIGGDTWNSAGSYLYGGGSYVRDVPIRYYRCPLSYNIWSLPDSTLLGHSESDEFTGLGAWVTFSVDTSVQVHVSVTDADGCEVAAKDTTLDYHPTSLDDLHPWFECHNEIDDNGGEQCCDERYLWIQEHGVDANSFRWNMTLRLIESPLYNHFNFTAIRQEGMWNVTFDDSDNHSSYVDFSYPDGWKATIRDSVCLPPGRYIFEVTTDCGVDTVTKEWAGFYYGTHEFTSAPQYEMEQFCDHVVVTQTSMGIESQIYFIDPYISNDEPIQTDCEYTHNCYTTSGITSTKDEFGRNVLVFSVPGTYPFITYSYNRPHSYYDPYHFIMRCSDYVYYYDTITVNFPYLDLNKASALLCEPLSPTGIVFAQAENGNEPYTYTLYDQWNSAGNVIATNSTGFFDNVPMTVGQHFTLQVTDSCSTSLSVNLTAAVLSHGNLLWEEDADSGPYCSGDTIRLTTLSFPPPVTYHWTGPNGFSSNSQTIDVVLPDYGENDWFKVDIFNSNICGISIADSILVTILPTPQVIITGDSSFCPGGFATLQATSSVAESSYLWDTGDTTPSINVTPEQGTTYSVTVTNTLAGCTATASQIIELRDSMPPVFYGTLPDGHVCPENGRYYVPDFTTYFTDETVSDNGYPFSSLTINQNPAAGTEIDTETEVTITLSDPCGNESLYSVEVIPYHPQIRVWSNTSCDERPNAMLRVDAVPRGFTCTFQGVTKISSMPELNPVPWTTLIFDFCQPGVYPLQITDNFGTVREESIVIHDSLQIPVFTDGEIEALLPNSSEDNGQISIQEESGFIYTIIDSLHQTILSRMGISGESSDISLSAGMYTVVKTNYYTKCFADTVVYILPNIIDSTYAVLPTVITDTVYNITSNSASSQGVVTDEGGSVLISRGLCWSVEHNPTLNDNVSTNGIDTGRYIGYITGLMPYTTYYVRAYATNSFGTAYGEEVSFTTCTNFTVSISGSAEIYIGQTVCLTASGAEHYIWNTGDTSAVVTVSPMVSTVYNVTGTDIVGCKKTTSTMVYVKAVPTITPTEVGTGLSEIELLCGGQPVTLCANTAIKTASDYTVESIPYTPPFSFTDGERLVENWDDNWTEASELTFPFVFYGNVYNQIVPGSNSVATFNADKANSFCAYAFSDTIPSTNLFSNTIFACYRDTYLRPNSSNNNDCVFAGVFGECPNRKYMLSFNNVHLFGSNYNIPGTFTTMIVLYEGTNVIDIYLQDTPNNSLTNNGNGVVGLQNNSGTKGIAPQGRNTGPWTAHEEAWRFIPVPITDYTVTWYLGTDTTAATGVVVGAGDTITVLPGESAYYTVRLQYTDNGESFDVANTCHVTVKDFESPISLIDSTVCESDLPITWNDVTFTEAGTRTVTLTNAVGCDSVVTLNLTLLHSTDTVLTATVIENDLPYVLNGHEYFYPNTYIQNTVNAFGCDSTIYLILNVIGNISDTISLTVCNSFEWNGINYTQSGDYTQYFSTVYGSDSVVTLHLTVHYSDTTEFYQTSCYSYTWNDETYTETGSYTQTLTNIYGCDSIVTLHLTIGYGSSGDTTGVACGSFDWYEYSNITESGVYTHIFEGGNSFGCDSILTLILIVDRTDSVFFEDTACDSYTWNDSTYYVSGDYIQHFQTVHGCDSTVTLHLSIFHPVHTAMWHWQCGGTYSWYMGEGSDTTLTESGDYLYSHTDENGCMQVDTLHLTIYSIPSSPTLTVAPNTSCVGANGSIAVTSPVGDQYTYSLNGIDFQSGTIFAGLGAGNYTVTVRNEYACTNAGSIFVEDVGNAISAIASASSSCSGGDIELFATTDILDASFTWDGPNGFSSNEQNPVISNVSPDDDGVYVVIVTENATGCSTTDNVIVGVKLLTVGDTTGVACGSFDWYEYSNITESGVYTHTFEGANSFGCDSTVMLHLTVHHSVSENVEATACDSYTWNGVTYTESGDYPLYLTTTFGCDSIVTLHLTINHSDTVVFPATACNSYNWNGVTYTESGDYITYMTNASGCDYVVVLHLTLNHSETEVVEVVACDSYTWNGVTYTTSGEHTLFLTNVNGCDSIVTLHLTIYHSETELVEVAACDSYTWNGVTYTESGDYTSYLATANGCDSTVTLHLTINNSVTEVVETTACESYTWNGLTYTESGIYPIHLTSSTGCDSLVTLQLTINHSDTLHFYATSCNSYNWNGETYTESGDYTTYMINSVGCDLVAILHLTVYETETSELYVTTPDTCYIWNDMTYCISGDYIQTFQSVDGCDSVVTLHLTITVGVDNHDFSNFMILYPNPTHNVVNVQLDKNQTTMSDVEIQLFDAYGKYLQTVPVINEITQVSLTRFASGIYFVKAVMNGQVVAVRKVVRE